MPIPLTEHGRCVLTEIHRMPFLVWTICGRNTAFNDRLTEEHERRKAETRADMIRDFGHLLRPEQNPDEVFSYTGENPAEQNQPFTAALEKFVSEGAVCRAVDLYHWYLRRVLQLALSRDRSLIRSWKDALNLSEKRTAEIESASSAESVLSSLFRGREKAFRDLVHKHLNVPDLSVIPMLVEVRNCIVHHLGSDVDGKVAGLVSECLEIGVEVRVGAIIVSSSAAFEGVARVLSD